MSTIRRESRPFDITYHIDTPGVPVTVRYLNEIIEVGDDGAETVLKSEITADCQADAATLAKHLGEALASGRAEEQRAIAAEASAIAERDRIAGELEAAKEQIKGLGEKLASLRAENEHQAKQLAALTAEGGD